MRPGTAGRTSWRHGATRRPHPLRPPPSRFHASLAYHGRRISLAAERSAPTMPPAPEPAAASQLEILDIATGDRRLIYRTGAHLEAPNWTRDGQALIYN